MWHSPSLPNVVLSTQSDPGLLLLRDVMSRNKTWTLCWLLTMFIKIYSSMLLETSIQILVAKELSALSPQECSSLPRCCEVLLIYALHRTWADPIWLPHDWTAPKWKTQTSKSCENFQSRTANKPTNSQWTASKPQKFRSDMLRGLVKMVPKWSANQGASPDAPDSITNPLHRLPFSLEQDFKRHVMRSWVSHVFRPPTPQSSEWTRGVFPRSGKEPEIKRWLVIVQWRLASHDCSSLHVSREFEGYGFLTALIQSLVLTICLLLASADVFLAPKLAADKRIGSCKSAKKWYESG